MGFSAKRFSVNFSASCCVRLMQENIQNQKKMRGPKFVAVLFDDITFLAEAVTGDVYLSVWQ